MTALSPSAGDSVPQQRRPLAGNATADVDRAGVVGRLLASSASAVALCAPGGYGKTTVLRQWLARDPRPSVLVTVVPEADDPAAVLARILNGLRSDGLLGDDTFALPPGYDPAAWSAALQGPAAALSAVGRPLLVAIDEAGRVSGDAWDTLLGVLVDALPSGSTLVLASRDPVPSPLRTLRARGEVLEIGPDDLHLTWGEARRLADLRGLRMDDEELEAVRHRTEGWPVAVSLALRPTLDGDPTSVAAALRPGTGTVADYLRDEVLPDLGDDLDFLRLASVLDPVDGEICAAVTDDPAAISRLRGLSSSHHLITPVDDEATVFRIHQLLAEVLADDLRAGALDRWRAANATAARAYERLGDVDAAVFHAVRADDDTLVEALIWSRTVDALAHGRSLDLQRWLDTAGPVGVARSCALSIADAWVATHIRDLDRLRRSLTIAHERCAATEADHAVYRPLIRVLDATVGAQGIDAMARDCDLALDELPADDPWRCVALYLRGVAHHLHGRPDAAIADLVQAYGIATARDLPAVVAHTSAGLADVHVAIDDPAAARRWFDALDRVLASGVTDGIATAAPAYTTHAMGLALAGELDLARRAAADALRRVAALHPIAPWVEVTGRLSLAGLLLSLGEAGQAAVLVQEARASHGPSSSAPLIDARLSELEAATRAAGPAGEGALTSAELRVLQYLPTHLSLPQIAQQLFVSPHTVKTQANSVYRKLGVHSRAEAVAWARDVGLLGAGADPLRPR